MLLSPNELHSVYYRMPTISHNPIRKMMTTQLIRLLSGLELFLFRAGIPGRVLMSAVRSVFHRCLHVFSIDKDGDYVNTQRDGVIVSPIPNGSDLRKIHSSITELWLASYLPRSGDVVLDVGAGIGDDAWVFAKYVGPSGRVFSFEANPRTARCLAKTVRQSGLENVETIAAAAADRIGRVLITDGAVSDRNSLIIRDGEHAVEVPAITLDDFVESKGINQIDLLKMNIEGAEKPALLGFQRQFGCVRNVAIACHDWIADLGYSDSFRTLAFVTEFLESQGFVVYRRTTDQRPWIRETILASRRP